MARTVILTGLRSNNELHIGNYLGAILPVVELQRRHSEKYTINMFIPDLHSITTPFKKKVSEQSIDTLSSFVAAGLDINNEQTFIYRQSFIPAHSELAWILSCFTYYGELNRMTQFKEKISQINKNPHQDEPDNSKSSSASVGLFNYPVLMAADILLYDAKYIPVGEDQRQHLELTRDLAIRLNNKFGDMFTIPEEWQKQLEFNQLDTGVRIRSLRDPSKKMSKSVDDPAGTIMLSDKPEEAAKKIMSSTTDSEKKITVDWKNQPGISNLLQILSMLRPSDDVYHKWQGKTNYGDLKKEVAEAVETFLVDFQSKKSNLETDHLLTKLTADEAHINIVANSKLTLVQERIGLR